MNSHQLRVPLESACELAMAYRRDVLMVPRINKQFVSATVNPSDIESPARSAVNVIGMTIIRDRVTVLRNIHLSVFPGETVIVMGPNGAGKSTLLRCIAGVVRGEQGDIHWFGNRGSGSLDARRRIGFAAHESGLYSELTALENLVFASRMYGVPDPGRHATELLTDAGLEAAANRMVGQLSQGMRQRLAIIRAIVHGPELVLLDEPFASLDAHGRDWLEGLFQQWRAAGRTVCFASHDPRECQGLADRVVSLDRGCIVAIESISKNATCLPQSA
jgi:heme exporter protein A